MEPRTNIRIIVKNYFMAKVKVELIRKEVKLHPKVVSALEKKATAKIPPRKVKRYMEEILTDHANINHQP